MDWFRAWLDDVAPPAARSCWSGSAAARRSPAAWCSTTRPASPVPRSSTARCRSTPACPPTPGRLAGLPVFVAQGDAGPGHPARAARPHLGLPADRLRRPAVRAARPRRARHHAPAPSTSSARGSPSGSRSSRGTGSPPSAAPRRGVADPARRHACPDRAGPRPAVSWTIPQQQQSRQRPGRAAGGAVRPHVARCPASTRARRAISVPGARGRHGPRRDRPRGGVPRPAGRRVRAPAPGPRRLPAPRAARRPRGRRVAKGWARRAHARRHPALAGLRAGLRPARPRPSSTSWPASSRPATGSRSAADPPAGPRRSRPGSRSRALGPRRRRGARWLGSSR